MKRFYLILFFWCLSFAAFAQQRPQFSQYMQNNFLINPAVAGIEPYTDVHTGYRSQWIGVEGAPVSMYASLHTPLGSSNYVPSSGSRAGRGNTYQSTPKTNQYAAVRPHHGIGAMAQADKAGALRISTLMASYAYHLPLSRKLNLASGISSGITQFNLNKEGLVLRTPDDPFIAGDNYNRTKWELSVGLWLYSKNFSVGLSGGQLLKSQKDVTAGSLHAALLPQYTLTGGYRLELNRRTIVIPSMMVKMAQGGQTAIDVNLKSIYGERFWGGVSYRHKDALALMAGVYVTHFLDVSYSYDFALTKMNRVSANTHEVVVGFKLNNPNKVICPQWIW